MLSKTFTSKLLAPPTRLMDTAFPRIKIVDVAADAIVLAYSQNVQVPLSRLAIGFLLSFTRLPDKACLQRDCESREVSTVYSQPTVPLA